MCGALSFTAQRFLTLPPIAMVHFDKDGFSPALQVTIYFFRSIFSCSFQAKSVLDAFEELNEPEDTKKVLLGYITRAKAAERTFSSQGGYTVVPDEDSKKLIINQAVVKDGETFFICHKCDDLTSFYNAKDFNIKEVGQCIHSKLSRILFANMVITDLNKTKNIIDVVKEGKETIALVFPCKDQKRPGVIHLTSRTKGIRCVTCSGQKCLHVNIYREEAKEIRAVGNMRERQMEKVTSEKPTEVVGNIELPFDVIAKESGNTDNDNLNPFAHSGKKSNVFGISINYPPDENEKEAIKRVNNEDIFPANIAAPTLEDDEMCEHGNKFSHELLPTNIESTNMQIHHTAATQDSRKSSLVLMFLRTEGCICECRKHFTGEPTIIVDIDNKSVLNYHQIFR